VFYMSFQVTEPDVRGDVDGDFVAYGEHVESVCSTHPHREWILVGPSGVSLVSQKRCTC
jgi:hypothetical protein